MADQYGFITQDSDPEMWTTLRALWVEDHKPGFVVRGSTHYQVFIENDVVKFKSRSNEDLYNSVSMGI